GSDLVGSRQELASPRRHPRWSQRLAVARRALATGSRRCRLLVGDDQAGPLHEPACGPVPHALVDHASGDGRAGPAPVCRLPPALMRAESAPSAEELIKELSADARVYHGFDDLDPLSVE